MLNLGNVFMVENRMKIVILLQEMLGSINSIVQGNHCLFGFCLFVCFCFVFVVVVNIEYLRTLFH